ncbi:MAG: hypothetical protein P0Y52_01120 [Candidatus Brevundimonas phytovorans]|nr:hypothetical protein [Brevundimonas sp.]WEK58166.1 MAG: hypothetical protein P0Y52_01120 [Brevundimonas sp.]
MAWAQNDGDTVMRVDVTDRLNLSTNRTRAPQTASARYAVPPKTGVAVRYVGDPARGRTTPTSAAWRLITK